MVRSARVVSAVICLALGVLARGSSASAQEKPSRDDERETRKEEGFDLNDEAANRGGSSKQIVVEGNDLNGEAMRRFTGPGWSLVYPDRDHQGGCVVGFLSFRFSPTGYFVYNNRVRGSWRVDEMGNLLLRTKDGLKFTLLVEGNTLRPVENLPFARRFYQFQRCPG